MLEPETLALAVTEDSSCASYFSDLCVGIVMKIKKGEMKMHELNARTKLSVKTMTTMALRRESDDKEGRRIIHHHHQHSFISVLIK